MIVVHLLHNAPEFGLVYLIKEGLQDMFRLTHLGFGEVCIEISMPACHQSLQSYQGIRWSVLVSSEQRHHKQVRITHMYGENIVGVLYNIS